MRVSKLINKKDREIRRLAQYLYEHDYLDSDEMDKVIRGEKLSDEKEQNKKRTWDGPDLGKFARF